MVRLSYFLFGVCGVLASFPKQPNHQDLVEKLIPDLDIGVLEATLRTFSTTWANRLYTHENGVAGARWLHETASLYAGDRLGADVSVKYFEHPRWLQPSVIARIEGTVNPTSVIIVGAHEDSTSRSPGADDDGSGSITCLEVFRVLMKEGFKPERTIEVQWYAAEEAGLLGSREIARNYADNSVQVHAMMNIDMDAHLTAFGITVVPPNMSGGDAELNDFLIMMIETYTLVCCDNLGRIPWRFGSAGGGSDHTAWREQGYKSCFGIEDPKSPYLHTPNDTIENISFEFMHAYSPAALGFVIELSFNDWTPTEPTFTYTNMSWVKPN